MQLGNNIARHDWDPLASTALMEEYMKAASSLVDDQNCLNNYADMCLNESSKHTNHSSKWKSNLSIDNPNIQAFIAKQNNIDIGGDGEDWQWRRCMKRELVARPRSTNVSRVENKENKYLNENSKKTGQGPSLPGNTAFKFRGPAPSITVKKSPLENDLPTFDLTDSDLSDFNSAFRASDQSSKFFRDENIWKFC